MVSGWVQAGEWGGGSLNSMFKWETDDVWIWSAGVFVSRPIDELGKCSCHCLLSICRVAADAHLPNAVSNRMQWMEIDFRPSFWTADAVNCCKWFRMMQHHLYTFRPSVRSGGQTFGRQFFHIVLWSYWNTPISFASYRSLWPVVQIEFQPFESADSDKREN